MSEQGKEPLPTESPVAEETRKNEAAGTTETKAHSGEPEKVKQEDVFIELSSSDEETPQTAPVATQSGQAAGPEEDEEEVTHLEENEVEMDTQVLKRINDYILQTELQVIEVKIEPYRSKRKTMRLTKTIVVSIY